MSDNKPKIAVLVNNSVDYDARVLKTSYALSSFGYRVAIFCFGENHNPIIEEKDGVEFWRYHKKHPVLMPKKISKTMSFARKAAKYTYFSLMRIGILKRTVGQASVKKGSSKSNKIHKIIFAVSKRYEAGIKQFNPDLIYAHDLDCLYTAHKSAQELGVNFVVDMHELQSERPFRNDPELRETVIQFEQKCLPEAAAVMTVSEKIADWYVETYSIDAPTVIYNSPELGFRNDDCKTDLRSELNLSSNSKICVYTGILTQGRGLENVIASLPMFPDLHYALVGPRNNVQAFNLLKKLAKDYSVADRVHFVDAVPHQQVSAFISTADFGIIPAVARTLNQEFGLPNKLFEMIFAGLPVVCVDIPQRRALLDLHGVGFYMSDNSPEEMCKTFADAFKYIEREGTKNHLLNIGVKALEEIGWGSQSRKIKTICDGLMERA